MLVNMIECNAPIALVPTLCVGMHTILYCMQQYLNKRLDPICIPTRERGNEVVLRMSGRMLLNGGILS